MKPRKRENKQLKLSELKELAEKGLEFQAKFGTSCIIESNPREILELIERIEMLSKSLKKRADAATEASGPYHDEGQWYRELLSMYGSDVDL